MKWVVAALFAALLVCLPSFAGDFYINLASQILIAAIFALSLNLLVGFGGIGAAMRRRLRAAPAA